MPVETSMSSVLYCLHHLKSLLHLFHIFLIMFLFLYIDLYLLVVSNIDGAIIGGGGHAREEMSVLGCFGVHISSVMQSLRVLVLVIVLSSLASQGRSTSISVHVLLVVLTFTGRLGIVRDFVELINRSCQIE